MAVHLGGIYSKPSGKAGGIVWGRARTRAGKLATSRAWVIPTNPNTDPQAARRRIFASAIHTSTLIGSPIWQASWNNTLGDLPGFHSLAGHLIDSLEDDAGTPTIIALPPSKSLGPVYLPDFTFQPGVGSGSITASWPAQCVGDHCAAQDKLMGFLVLKAAPDTAAAIQVLQPDATARGTETWTSAAVPGSPVLVYVALWFQHDPGGDEPLEWSSLAQSVSITSAA